MSCSQIGRRSTRTYRGSSTSRPSPWGSRSRWSRSRTSSGQAPAGQGNEDRLTGFLPLDAATAVVELTPLPLIITANAAVGKRWANLAAEVLGGVVGGLICLLGAADLAGARVLSPAPNVDMQRALDLTVMATGLLAPAVASWPVRSRIASVLPIDPQSPVQALALSLTVILFGVDVASISFTDVLASAS